MNQVWIDFTQSKGTIHRDIYGHFAEHIGGVFYDGMWVGEDSKVENVRGFRKALVDSFRKLNPSVLRWPGGCFAETYDWRDGIGPRGDRPERVNWWYSHDKRLESNHVGTHEFMDFCRMVGAEPYFAANMTTVTPLHIRNWMEYCNFPEGSSSLAKERGLNGDPAPFDIRLWGIGNENWGAGGQMSPEMCAREFIRYATICDSLDKGNFKFIICGANGRNVEWTRRLMREWSTARPNVKRVTYGMSIHYYTNDRVDKDPINFSEDDWYLQLFKADGMRLALDEHRAAMREFDPEGKVGLIVDEWGNWHTEGYGPTKGYNLFEQPSNMRDAIVAAMTLNIFNNTCDSVVMANVAQLVNNLHSLYLAGGDQFVETPNYHVFEMYKGHMDARQLGTSIAAETLERDGYAPMQTLSASASVRDGKLTLTLANLSLTEAKDVRIAGIGGSTAGKATVRTLSHAEPRTCNTYDNPAAITPRDATVAFIGEDTVTVPAAGVVSVEIELA